MSERLMRIVNEALVKEDAEVLAERAKLSVNTIRLIADGSRLPRKRNIYKLAIACGRSEAEALELALECPPVAKTAS